MQFNNSDLQVIKLALSIAKGKAREPKQKGKSFLSWRSSPTKNRMQELEDRIQAHLSDPTED